MVHLRRLQYLREEKKLKQSDISKILELEKDTYGEYERGKSTIPIKHLNSVCNYFNVSLDYIFDFSSTRCYKNYKDTIDLKIVSYRLKEFRKDNKLTQDKLAKILNVVKSTISNYERSRALIATPFLYTICKKYNISADYLLGKIDSPKYLKK